MKIAIYSRVKIMNKHEKVTAAFWRIGPKEKYWTDNLQPFFDIIKSTFRLQKTYQVQ